MEFPFLGFRLELFIITNIHKILYHESLTILLKISKYFQELNGNFILAGNFNNSASDIGYNYFMAKKFNEEKLVDVYHKANKGDFNTPTIRGNSFNVPERIDYIITNDRQNIVVQKCEFIFTDDYGDERVSDHMGVLSELSVNGN